MKDGRPFGICTGKNRRRVECGPFPAEPMRMWPPSPRVNKPENDDPSILEPIELAWLVLKAYRLGFCKTACGDGEPRLSSLPKNLCSISTEI